MPAISVIIPTYNRAELVPLAIDSVLAQVHPAAEIIVVDNGSKDHTPEVLARYGDRIKVVRLDPNAGLSGARNAGILAAKSEWIAFLDDDDEFAKERLQIAAESIKRFPSAQVHVTNTLIVSEDTAPIDLFEYRKVSATNWMPLDRPISWILRGCFFAQALVCRHSALTEAGLYRQTLYEDMDMYVRLVRHAPWIVDGRPSFRLIRRSNTPVLSYDWRSKPVERADALIRIHRAALALPGLTESERKLIKTGLGTALFELGRAKTELRDRTAARTCFLEAARTFPSLLSRLKSFGAFMAGKLAIKLIDLLSRKKANSIR